MCRAIATRLDAHCASVLFQSAEGAQWLFTGGYGSQLDVQNNPNVDQAMMSRLYRMINNLELREIELLERRFTRSNERVAPSLVHLDRAFCSSEWDQIFPNYTLQSTTAGISDHCPLLLNLGSNCMGRRRFHFESFCPKLQGFMEVVAQAWHATDMATHLIQRLAEKLKATSRALEAWRERCLPS